MKPELNYAIGTRVRRAREAAGMTQEALAGAIDRSKEAISNIERGINLPTIDTLQRICDVTGVTTSFMFDQTNLDPEIIDIKAQIDVILARLSVEEIRILLGMLTLYKNSRGDLRTLLSQ